MNCSCIPCMCPVDILCDNKTQNFLTHNGHACSKYTFGHQ